MVYNKFIKGILIKHNYNYKLFVMFFIALSIITFISCFVSVQYKIDLEQLISARLLLFFPFLTAVSYDPPCEPTRN